MSKEEFVGECTALACIMFSADAWISRVVLFAFLERGHRKRREDPFVSELLADLLSGSSLDSFLLGSGRASATGVHVRSALNIITMLVNGIQCSRVEVE